MGTLENTLLGLYSGLVRATSEFHVLQEDTEYEGIRSKIVEEFMSQGRFLEMKLNQEYERLGKTRRFCFADDIHVEFKVMRSILRKGRDRRENMSVEDITGIAQNAYSFYRFNQNMLSGADYSPWDQLNEWLQQYYIFMATEFNKHPYVDPSIAHDAWIAEKQMHGYAYGPREDRRERTNPFMQKYHNLPQSAKFVITMIRSGMQNIGMV